MNAAKSSLPGVLLIGMVLHCSLSCNNLDKIESTSARDLICSLVIEKVYQCYVQNSISLDKGGSNECIPTHKQVNVSNHRSLKPFS